MNVFENLSFTESIFEMIDVNKWLRFNTTTDTQENNVQRIEDNLKELLKKLYIPTPIENV